VVAIAAAPMAQFFFFPYILLMTMMRQFGLRGWVVGFANLLGKVIQAQI